LPGHLTSAARRGGTRNESKEKAAKIVNRDGIGPIILDTNRLALVPGLIN
jgi:hypothetical protein